MVGLRGYFLSIACVMLASQVSSAQITPEPLCVIYYVDQNATGPVHDGSSWCSAFLGLSDALLVAGGCDTIRVADGVYTPSTQGLDDPRDATFQILSGMTWEGGYQGCGAYRPEVRDVDLYKTLLSGDLNGDDDLFFGDNSDNSYNVVTAKAALETATIDGFSVAHGNARSPGINSGAGIFFRTGSLNINHCDIYDNHANDGGGIYILGQSINITNTHIHDNTADYGGGGLDCFGCSITLVDSEISYNAAKNGGGMRLVVGSLSLERVIIRGNRASELPGGNAGVGGGLFLFNVTATINNSLLVDNRAAHGGAVFLSDHHIDVSNSTIVRNFASNSRVGGGISIQSGTVDLTNSILWGNRGGLGTTLITTQIDWGGGGSSIVAYSHNDIELWNTSLERFQGNVGNFAADPLFADEYGADNIPGNSDDDFRLSSSSPCINRGDPMLVSPIGATDFDGNARTVGCRTDIGAYESTKINIDNDYDSDDQITLADYAKLQLFWGAIAGASNEADAYTCVFDTSSDGAVNLADLPNFVEKLEDFSQPVGHGRSFAY